MIPPTTELFELLFLVFELCGKFVTIGSKGSEKGEFMFPSSTANPTDAEGYSDMHNSECAVTLI